MADVGPLTKHSLRHCRDLWSASRGDGCEITGIYPTLFAYCFVEETTEMLRRILSNLSVYEDIVGNQPHLYWNFKFLACCDSWKIPSHKIHRTGTQQRLCIWFAGRAFSMPGQHKHLASWHHWPQPIDLIMEMHRLPREDIRFHYGPSLTSVSHPHLDKLWRTWREKKEILHVWYQPSFHAFAISYLSSLFILIIKQEV